ncbi:8-oxo-dGTP pyrophosphatase MutT, NUDIX family [Aliiroseovarius crassostreae]|uniref:DNA mismatch repair protein MutT n=1 Tax=Aliiroseovarius crassostreae TaxID=154981 RepID=A0A0N8IB57_9RHOB|nr:NUDIX hydrolase [Aliiroseovarius crassostreae]KPN62179.1 DNA mismatch repair protein MutT [Aliiroseovarius crassostreae]SFU53998.1 8-oxo-dGTP pyrophosphatase MutT, NUDIX family [Aliiroseovarius crassostreae]
MDKSKIIRNAATVILIRDAETAPQVLMGQRGAKAAFMPNKFVFPGGAVDTADGAVPLAQGGAEPCLTRLGEDADPNLAQALLVAAIRELWEETGQILGAPGTWPGDVPADWKSFSEAGYVPSADGLAFAFRAITPKGRPRRFDARFFVADASKLKTDPDDFSRASDELSHLQWIPMDKVRRFDLPFITEVVLAEIAGNLPNLGAPEQVPFFNNTDEESLFERLGGVGPFSAQG